jgi:hypothetical protein
MSIKTPTVPPNATPEQLLRAMMDCFYQSSDGLEWMYVEGATLRNLLGPEAEQQLKKYWTNPHE